ncbi:MAG: hypothetical protein DRJ37_05700, partial [Thermoprotei archaeon]
MRKLLIEKWLPLTELNIDSLSEIGFKGTRASLKTAYKEIFGIQPMITGPRLRNIHVWWARRPCSPSRVLCAAAVLPPEMRDALKDVCGISYVRRLRYKYKRGLIFYTTPDRDTLNKILLSCANRTVRDITVVDPMAGGGAIPLEALRLGFKTIAMEYNPVAYLILKATLEFPAKYADSDLFEETLKEAKVMIKWTKEHLARFYSQNDGYIFARGVRCPFCQGLIPVQGIEPEITKAKRFRKRFLKITYDKEQKTFLIETTDTKTEPTIQKRGFFIKCPYCNKWFQVRGRGKGKAETAFDKWFKAHAALMRSVIEGFVPITQELEEKMLELHIPLVKQVGSSFEPVWNDKVEIGLFLEAFKTLGKRVFKLRDYMPLDIIPSENKWCRNARNKGLTNWYMLYNPRQLLVLSELIRYVAHKAEELASSNGEFGAAIALYLAFSLSKMADYNTIATRWHLNQGKIVNTMRRDNVDFRSDYCEAIPVYKNLPWALELDIAETGALTRTRGGILPVLRFLVDEFKGSSLGDRISIYLADATELSTILKPKSVDIINVDPPYFEQVIYSDRSEFFWVILRRALWPVLDTLFKPGLRLKKWSWRSSVIPRDHEVVAYDKEDRNGRFRVFFTKFIAETAKVLKDNGVLVLWFTHPTDLAWRTVGYALYEAGYVVSRTWPIKTEMPTRIKKLERGIAQETSLIIVARKYKRKRLVEVSKELLKESLMENPAFRARAGDTAIEI